MTFLLRRKKPEARPNLVQLSLHLDSSMIQFYGTEKTSSGFILNGSISLGSKDLEQVSLIQVKSLKLEMIQKVSYSKPFIFNDSIIAPCEQCRHKTRIIKELQLAEEDELCYLGNFDSYVPFSFLVPGTLPPTSKLGLALDTSISYEICISLVYNGFNTADTLVTVLRAPVTVTRTVNELRRTYLRKFETTNLQARASIPGAVYAKSSIPLELSLRGVQSSPLKRWTVDCVRWRLCEVAQATEDPCQKHAPLLDELKDRLNTAKNPWKLYTAKTSTLEVKKDFIPDRREGNLIYGDRMVDEDILNREEELYHPLDPENPNRLMKPLTTNHESGVLLYSDERVICSGEIQSGWKKDYTSGGSGRLYLEKALSTKSLGTCGLAESKRHVTSGSQSRNLKEYRKDLAMVNCCLDIARDDHFKVLHKLYLDLEMSEEYVEKSGVSITGIKKTLRMDFPVLLMERGVHKSWDSEAPPLYQSDDGLPEYRSDASDASTGSFHSANWN